MTRNEENNGVEKVSAAEVTAAVNAETDSTNQPEPVSTSELIEERSVSEQINDETPAADDGSLTGTTETPDSVTEAEVSADDESDSDSTGDASYPDDDISESSEDTDPETESVEASPEDASDSSEVPDDSPADDMTETESGIQEDPDATGLIFLTEPVSESEPESEGVQIDLDHEEKAPPERELKLGETDKKPKSRKKLWIVLGSIAAVLAAVYLIGVWRFSQVFLPGTYVDGFSAANKDVQQTEELIKSGTAERTVSVFGSDGKTETITAGDIDLVFSDNLDLETVIAQQNPWTWPAALVGSERRDLASDYTYSSDKLNALISASPFLTGTDIVATENAKASYDGSTFVVQKEVYGTQVDSDKLKDAVLKGLLTGQDNLDLEESRIYVQPTVLEDSADLQASVSKLNQIASTVVTYTFGNTTETVDKSVFLDWLSTDDQGNVNVDSTKAAVYVQELADKYDTLYTYQSFNTSYGSTVEVYAAGYGWEIDQKEETAELVSLISSASTTTREPVYDSKGADRTLSNAVGGDYIEISISGQTMWCYSNGQLVTSTPVTTGTISTGYGTPTGLYEIAYKDTNVNLEGNNADGSAYSSPVSFWIPFNGGIGIHDSSWRSSYGGDVYLTSGSHGCVNTPYSAVATIYENCYAGEPVVVY